MLVPCRCDCHTDPLPYRDECCDGPASLHEQLEAAERLAAERLDTLTRTEAAEHECAAKLAEVGRERREWQHAAHVAGELCEAAESREKALREALAALLLAWPRYAGLEDPEKYAHRMLEDLSGCTPECPGCANNTGWHAALAQARAALAAGKETGSECVNGCHKPVCPPSRVLCADCFAELDGKMQALAAGKKN